MRGSIRVVPNYSLSELAPSWCPQTSKNDVPESSLLVLIEGELRESPEEIRFHVPRTKEVRVRFQERDDRLCDPGISLLEEPVSAV
jgi:hypothetical protein